MKTCVLNRSLLILIVGAAAAFNPIKAQQVEIDPATTSSGSTARLVVNRSADFGANEVVDLFVDGAKVATLGYNQSYQAALPTGKHVLSISTDPKTYPESKPTAIAINAKPGETYSFTAVWPDSERAGLVAN
jgi:hypothetical protein